MRTPTSCRPAQSKWDFMFSVIKYFFVCLWSNIVNRSGKMWFSRTTLRGLCPLSIPDQSFLLCLKRWGLVDWLKFHFLHGYQGRASPCCFLFFTCRYFQGFVLRPGHENLVAMGAISTVADDAIKCKLTFIFHSKCNGNSNDNETLIAVDFNVKDRSNLIHYYGNGI